MKDTLKLKHEVKMLHSFVASIVGHDPEGEYRPEFVRHIMQTLKRSPTRKYKDAKTFLAELTQHD